MRKKKRRRPTGESHFQYGERHRRSFLSLLFGLRSIICSAQATLTDRKPSSATNDAAQAEQCGIHSRLVSIRKKASDDVMIGS